MRRNSTQLQLELDTFRSKPAPLPAPTETLDADIAALLSNPSPPQTDRGKQLEAEIKAYLAEPEPVAKNPYEEKQAASRARLERGAERARRDPDRAFGSASRISGAIPMGPPVGHHSERPYRRNLAKTDRALSKGVEARAAAVRAARIPLYNHTSLGTAYLVDDYPYGRTARCRIRYWIESDPKKGFRFVSQTERPGTSHWNAPKKSTYHAFGACMYLDEKGHVQVRGLSAYSTAEETLAFVRDFPGAELSRIRQWVTAKAAYVQGCLDGRIVVRINGEVRPWTEADQERHRAELAIWRHVERLLAK